MRRSLLASLLLCIPLLSCGAGGVEPLPAQKVDDCKTACEHLRSMSCELGEPSKRGKTCEDDLCPTLEANGVKFISCTIDATSCDAADTCSE